MQYLAPLGEVFPPGIYVFGGASDSDISQMQSLLRRQGLEIQGGSPIPLLPYLLHDPLVGATGLLFVLGHACAVAYWSLLLGTRRRELLIHRRHGAHLATLVRRWFAAGLLAIALGLTVGVGVSGIVVALVGRAGLTGAQYLTLVQATVLGLVTTSLVWLATTAVGLRVRDEVRRAA